MRCKNFLPPGDTFLEMEIKTIATFNSQAIATFSRRLFLYRPINFYRQLIPTKQILSPNLEEKILWWKQRDNMKTSFTASDIISFGSTSM